MVVSIQNYKSSPRLAVVRFGNENTAGSQTHEEMRIEKDSLTFSFDGRSYPLGENFEKFKDAFHDGDIVTVNHRGSVQQLFDFDEHNATVYITGQCNSNCVMCPCSDYERKNNTGMPDEWMREYIEMLPDDVPHVVVTGGEPTLKTEQFFLVMELLAEKLPKAETLLLTNGRSFASKALLHRFLERCPPFLVAGIPVHGHCAELHDSITRAPGSFQQTLQGIENLLANHVAVELRIVISKLNHEHLSEIADLIISRFPQAYTVNFIGLETMGNCAKNFNQVYIDHRDAWKDIQPAVVKLMHKGIRTQLYNYPLCAVDQGFWAICKKSITPNKVRFPQECGACEASKQCGGFFFSTLAVAKPPVFPVHF